MPSQESQLVNSEHDVPQISRRKALGITGSTAALAGLGISLARPTAALAGTTDDGYFNVTEAPYKAAGDGSTDDTEALQEAIDDASSAGGGTVLLPSGTYRIVGTGEGALLVPDKVRLLGMGHGSVIKHSNSPASDVRIFRIEDNATVAFESLVRACSTGVEKGSSEYAVEEVSNYV